MKYIIGFAAAVILLLLFTSPFNCNKQKTEPMESPKELRNETRDIKLVTKAAYDSLQRKYDKLDTANTILRNKNVEQSILISRQKRDIRTLTGELNTPDSSETVESVREKGNAVALACDTLATMYEDYIGRQDSIISNQDTMLVNRNAAITVGKNAFDSLQKTALKAIRNYEITDQKLKKRNVGNYVWKGVAVLEFLYIISKLIKL